MRGVLLFLVGLFVPLLLVALGAVLEWAWSITMVWEAVATGVMIGLAFWGLWSCACLFRSAVSFDEEDPSMDRMDGMDEDEES